MQEDSRQLDLYADGTSGQQGEASKDAEPQRRRIIRKAHDKVIVAGPHGITWRELAAQMDWHHGQASGALSNLHRMGWVARLRARRDRCGVYVLPEYVYERETVPHRSNRTQHCPHCGGAL